MAGDWIKMSVNLPDKPEVWQIAGVLGIDADAVVGKLLRVWAWFDAHTEDGNAVGVTYPLVDRIAGVTGFAEAMALAGWLQQNGHVMSCPKFERHNGKTAKNRALANERVAKHRSSNADGNAPSVTKTVTREEKRREEKNTPSLRSGVARATRKAPEDFAVTDDMRAWAAADCLGVDIDRETEKFRDHTFKTAHSDWPAAWRNWMRRAADNVPRRSAPAGRSFAEQAQAAAAQRVASFAPGVAARSASHNTIDMEAGSVFALARD